MSTNAAPPITPAQQDRAQVRRIRRVERVVTGIIYTAIVAIHLLIALVVYHSATSSSLP